jgi:hypothetical protein
VAIATGTYFWMQAGEDGGKQPVEDVDVTVTTPRN